MRIQLGGNRPLTAQEFREAANSTFYQWAGDIAVGPDGISEPEEYEEEYDPDLEEEALRQTGALRNYIGWSTETTNNMAYWYAAANPGATQEEIAEYLEATVQEMISTVGEHTAWLAEQGLLVGFRHEEAGLMPLLGLGYSEDNLGLLAQARTAEGEALVCPITDVSQFVVLSA